ncbi:AAA family ATPase [Candidatus Pacearchaeota archaeon]|nr:AAA family ATPase [Candidatus Pacearchaeota archaeon]
MIKIIITGLPGSGKSTVLEKVISDIKNKKGFITREIRNNGLREGFKIVTNNGKDKILASIHFKTPHKVSKYYVDLNGFEEILPEFFNFSKNETLYIDEIGEMELFSKQFEELIMKYLNSENTFLATLSKVYSNDLIKSIKERKDVKIVEITADNREEKLKEIKKMIK